MLSELKDKVIQLKSILTQELLSANALEMFKNQLIQKDQKSVSEKNILQDEDRLKLQTTMTQLLSVIVDAQKVLRGKASILSNKSSYKSKLDLTSTDYMTRLDACEADLKPLIEKYEPQAVKSRTSSASISGMKIEVVNHANSSANKGKRKSSATDDKKSKSQAVTGDRLPTMSVKSRSSVTRDKRKKTDVDKTPAARRSIMKPFYAGGSVASKTTPSDAPAASTASSSYINRK